MLPRNTSMSSNQIVTDNNNDNDNHNNNSSNNDDNENTTTNTFIANPKAQPQPRPQHPSPATTQVAAATTRLTHHDNSKRGESEHEDEALSHAGYHHEERRPRVERNCTSSSCQQRGVRTTIQNSQRKVSWQKALRVEAETQTSVVRHLETKNVEHLLRGNHSQSCCRLELVANVVPLRSARQP